MSVTTTGLAELDAKFAAVIAQAEQVQKSATRAAAMVLASAARRAVPGTIKQEIGKYMLGTKARAGLLRFPQRGVRGRQPHGVFLDYGTKFIQPRRWVANALSAAQPQAEAAAQRAASRKIESIFSSN